MTQILDQFEYPDKLKELSLEELNQLAEEIRVRLLEIGNQCGGHLASNLGVVELTIALHTIFSSPTDKLIWDTSHQCYVHKLLTGRRDQMFTIRQDNGLSGFANINESDHDIFGAGHASTALSAALGLAHARDILNRKNHVISIIGDASLSGGMAYEALNNIKHLKSPFICILNDNNMSISKPVGNMADYITKVRTSSTYNQIKENCEKLLDSIPLVGPSLFQIMEKIVDRSRDVVLNLNNNVIFEEFGLRYIGPIDGHNIPLLIALLNYSKQSKEPVMLHIVTQKGKGHEPAEDNPIKYHGVKPNSPKKTTKKKQTFTEVFGKKVIDLATRHPNLVVITPAMTEGSGLKEYQAQFPDRFFDVGIAEEHSVTFAAGLARDGIIPILSIYSTFLQRGYDQIIHDVCLQNLPVIFTLDRAGLVGEDGPTHHGVFDYNYFLPIPNMIITAPKDGNELEQLLDAAMSWNAPTSIRFPKSSAESDHPLNNTPIELGKAEVLHQSSKEPDIVLVAAGHLAENAYSAALELEKKNVHVTVINLRFIKPFDKELLEKYFKCAKKIVIVEEGMGIGGISPYLLSEFPQYGSKWSNIALPDHFQTHGTLATLRAEYQLDTNGILNHCLKIATIHQKQVQN